MVESLRPLVRLRKGSSASQSTQVTKTKIIHMIQGT